ncbi:MAG: caspase family protein, partial [Bacillota bacterium]
MRKTILVLLALSLVLIFALGFSADAATSARGGVTPSNIPWNRQPSKKVTVEFKAPETSGDVSAAALTKIALIIGISDYSGTSNDLNYCDDDAREVYDTLAGKYGFPTNNITLLLDSKATDANIRAGVDWLIANSGPGSSVVFYYSGHGSRSSSNMDSDAEKQDECIIPWELSRIWDGELAAKFAQLTSTNNWICFDSCYSGGMNDIGNGGEVVT